MRVLVTRPQPGADRTASRLAGRGHDAVVLPVTEAIVDLEPLQAVRDRQWSALALTSANAARALAAAPAAVAGWRDVPVYAVGPRTATAVTKAGFAHVVPAEGDGGALAALVAASPGDAPVLYLAGEPRASRFERELTAAGKPFETIVVYRMRPRRISPAEADGLSLEMPFDATLFYSRASAETFFRLAEESGLTGRLRLGRILCLSEQVRAGLAEPFREQALVADRPSEERLLALLGETEH